jgi:hypothetical protein
MVIDGSGNVGIGTTSPQSLLHVEEGDIRIDAAASGNVALRFSEVNNTRAQIQYKSFSEELNFITDDASGSDVTRMTIKSEQDATAIGIGTTSPSEMLHLQGTGDVKILLEADTDNATETDNPEIIFSQDGGLVTGIAALTSNNTFWLANTFDDTTGALKLGTRNTARITIEGDGNVGIGTESPTTKLDVEGTVSYKHIAFTTAGPTDNVDVSGTTVLEVDTSGGSVTIGGFTGGVQGQILYVVKTTLDTYTLKLENNEGGGSQDIFSSDNSDISLVRIRGGVTLYCNGTSWFVLNK